MTSKIEKSSTRGNPIKELWFKKAKSKVLNSLTVHYFNLDHSNTIYYLFQIEVMRLLIHFLSQFH
jgi:hypothetical protein